MKKILRHAGVVLTLLICSFSANAATDQLMTHLQHMRLASVGIMTDFFMYTGLEGDRKYARRMQSDVESFETAMQKAIENASRNEHKNELNGIQNDWLAFTNSLNSNRNLIQNQGFPSVEMVNDLTRLNSSLTERIGSFYKLLAGNSDTNPLVQRTREMALMLQEMTTQYAASASMDHDANFLDEYQTSMQKLTSDFEFKLEDLRAQANAKSNYVLMDNINNKWRFLRNSITRQHEMDVPFLVISYNDRIIRHLEELEGKIGNS
ncbi:hypothetical protein [Oceanobacter mangrovi]|uniref:hypothetical protein n=1 Tax=Oceanobacter mangrovi TaxID=2862510 RepID=UPI001C8D2C68|nr:hypothetical protein [Oceanobacter mangrovi]